MQKWAKALSPRPRYGVMTSNTAESMSSKDKNASDMPMTTLMEWLRSVVQDCASSKLTVTPSTNNLFQVYNKDNKKWIVNMEH
ncbi:hypothetical protein TIFTF001_027339 [Ficus carica]|uniref:Uncharacterized protein n=1 Tax=Ficus carica TaxID=3494 RepID=A0AA88DMS3_FICCA|nr:hypothetical protein TIFTF001_027339 [Ficus carica]